jgi:hypothetical protein
MYKNATKHHRSDRHNPDTSELQNAAGISPRGTPEFIREVKFAVARGGKKTKNYPELARYLNDRNVLNARGYPWTPATLEAFIRHYQKSSRPQPS